MFWRELEKAYNRIASHNEQVIEIEVGDKHAKIAHNEKLDCIVIVINQVEVKQPALIVPT